VAITYLGFPQQTEQLASLDKIHHHVQVLVVLKGSPQRDQEGVFYFLQHLPLIVGVFDLFHFDHLSFLQNLDRIEAQIVSRLNQMDTTEASSTQGPLQHKVTQRVFALRGSRLLCLLLLLLSSLVIMLRRVVLVRGAILIRSIIFVRPRRVYDAVDVALVRLMVRLRGRRVGLLGLLLFRYHWLVGDQRHWLLGNGGGGGGGGDGDRMGRRRRRSCGHRGA